MGIFKLGEVTITDLKKEKKTQNLRSSTRILDLNVGGTCAKQKSKTRMFSNEQISTEHNRVPCRVHKMSKYTASKTKL